MTTTPIYVHTSAASAIRHSCTYGWHRLDIDLSDWSEAERDELASTIVEQDGAKYGMRDRKSDPVSPYDVAPPTAERLREVVNESIADRLASEQAKQDRVQRELDAFLDWAKETPISALVGKDGLSLKSVYGASCHHTCPVLILGDDERIAAEVVGRETEARLAMDEIQKEKAAERERESAEDRERLAKIDREQKAMTQWLRDHDFPEQAERHEAGVLPREELEVLVGRVAFEPLAPWGNPVKHDDLNPQGLEDFDAHEWRRYKAIKQDAEELGGKVELQWGWDEVLAERRKYLTVTLAVHGVEASCTYLLF